MLSDLVALGRRLRANGRIPPPGYADYSAPIRWRLSVTPPSSPGGSFAFTVVEDDRARPRPDSGRTSGVFAYPLVDTAAYVFGVATKADGKQDGKAGEKRVAFVKRLTDTAAALPNGDLRTVVEAVCGALRDGRVTVPEAVKADEWVAVEVTNGPLAGAPLFEHPALRTLWQDEVRAAVHRAGDVGTCSVTGADGPLVFRVPGKGYFQGGRASLLGLDADAYVSLAGGPAVSKKAHIGLSYDAADLANRALEYLARSTSHRRTLVYDKNSDLRSVTALLWLDVEEPVIVGDAPHAYDPEAFAASLLQSADTFRFEPTAVKADLADIHDILKGPVRGATTGKNLDAAAVHLGVLSKNAFRVVVRDYRTETLGDLRRHLAAFDASASLALPLAGPPQARAATVHEMMRAVFGLVDENGKLRATATQSTGHARALFRTAYFGEAPPLPTLAPALARVRALMAKEADAQRGYRLHALLSLVKLLLTYHPDPGSAMPLEPLPGSSRNELAFRCGELLAVLGRIQQDALTDDNNRKSGKDTPQVLNRTVTERTFGAASVAPAAYLGVLVQRATTAHLPKLPDARAESGTGDFKWRQGWAQSQIETLADRIHELGGFPATLDLRGQGEFALGYYHRRHRFFQKKDAASGSGDAPSPDADAPAPEPSTDLFTPAS